MLKIKLSKPISVYSREELEQIVRDEFESFISENRDDKKDMLNLFRLLSAIDEISTEISWRKRIKECENIYGVGGAL